MFYWREEAKRNHRKLIVLLSNRGWHLTYINHNYTDENQTSENKNELNIFEIISFGCNIVARWLIQHWEEKNGSRSKHTEKNSKGYCSIYPKNVAKNLFIFLNFHPLKKKRKKKNSMHLLDLEYASPNKKKGLSDEGCFPWCQHKFSLQVNTHWF